MLTLVSSAHCDKMEESLLAQRRTALIKRWIDAVLNTYPNDAANFMRRQKDAFANPSGHFVRECIPVLVDALETGVELEKVQPPLEELIKLRALQDYTPSQAVHFIFAIKAILRDELDFKPDAAQWRTLDSRVDELGLIAFDVYMRSREKVYEVRYNQLKKLNHVMLERANRGQMPRTSKLRKTEPDNRGDEE